MERSGKWLEFRLVRYSVTPNYLDSGNKKIILDRIEGLLAPNKIIVVVSHDELIIQKEGISLLDIKKIAD